MMDFTLKKIFLLDMPSLLRITSILQKCGVDMYEKYGLSHWKNSFIKTFLVICFCILKKKKLYGVYNDAKQMIATFQVLFRPDSVDENAKLYFGKLAVSPECGGKGIGSYCLDMMEQLAQKNGVHILTCEVYDKSEFALTFYLKKGFKIVGQKNSLKYTQIVLEKSI